MTSLGFTLAILVLHALILSSSCYDYCLFCLHLSHLTGLETVWFSPLCPCLTIEENREATFNDSCIDHMGGWIMDG